MSSQIDVAKLVRIALCFLGVVTVVSGVEYGLTRLANRTPLESSTETRDVILYGVGMALYCPLAFGVAALGLGCIRYNKPLARLFEKYSRQPSRIGQPRWKFSEIHALFCVAFGAFLCYAGIVAAIMTLVFVIDMIFFDTRFLDRIYQDISFCVIIIFAILGCLIIGFAPGALFIRFARRLTGMMGKKLAQ